MSAPQSHEHRPGQNSRAVAVVPVVALAAAGTALTSPRTHLPTSATVERLPLRGWHIRRRTPQCRGCGGRTPVRGLPQGPIVCWMVAMRHCLFAALALRNPRDATLSLNRFSVRVMLRVAGATQVTCGRTTCVLDCAARRTRERDIHAAITRSVVGVRRVVGYYPCRRAGSNHADENADRYQHGTAFARCERVGWGGLASVDRRRLLRAANSTGLR